VQVRPIGVIRSALKTRAEAPKQGAEGAPDAWIDIDPAFAAGLDLVAGDAVIVHTWLHRAKRDVLKLKGA
jgi:tRNA (Thr-GGU) A37 N-methylase